MLTPGRRPSYLHNGKAFLDLGRESFVAFLGLGRESFHGLLHLNNRAVVLETKTAAIEESMEWLSKKTKEGNERLSTEKLSSKIDDEKLTSDIKEVNEKLSSKIDAVNNRFVPIYVVLVVLTTAAGIAPPKTHRYVVDSLFQIKNQQAIAGVTWVRIAQETFLVD